ncbi:pheromone A receptor-domain-containing protein [Xylariaceae sp. FL1651]|nr:pheromone A receptor-domain-containing protein [Xylariaceae sp. FL1651]
MAQKPTANPGLLANLISRVILAVIGNLLCWVPLRLLFRNGEFAAVVLIVDVAIMNIFTIVNSIIWHSDHWDTWWEGTGLCDIEVYLSGPLQTIYAASIFTVMYHLVQQIKVTRATRLDQQETTRRNLIQAAIIFPIPLVQLLFTYFDLAQRYIIGTLIGCSAVYDSSWPKNLVYDAPPAMFALLSVPYAVLLWKRFHTITKKTQTILQSGSQASIRANRTRRRLYNMSLSILVIYLPVMLFYFVMNIQDTLSSYKTYDFSRIRWSASPYPWNAILFVPSWLIPLPVMNQPWIPIATTVAIVAFFGTTIEAQDAYRRYARLIGLGACCGHFKWKKDAAHPHPPDMSGATADSGNTLLSIGNRDSNEQPHTGPISPTLEYPQGNGILETRPSPSKPSTAPQSPIDIAHTPPVIPPRHSSLRRGFLFRTPTFRSITQSIRLPSIPSISRSYNASGASTSSASNRATGSLTNREDSIPMLPLHTSNRLGEPPEDSPRTLDSFSTGASRDPMSLATFDEGLGAERLGSRSTYHVRIPIVRPASTLAGSFGGSGRSANIHGAERVGVVRDQTLTSLSTASDAPTNQSSMFTASRASEEYGVYQKWGLGVYDNELVLGNLVKDNGLPVTAF